MTGNDLISGAARLCGVLAAGEVLPATDAQNMLQVLNDMIDAWGTQSTLIIAKVNEIFPLVANQQVYTWGPTGNFASSRPMKIEAINWQQVSGTTTLDLPIEIMSQDQWAAVAIKTITSNLPTRMWPQYFYPNMSLTFWPIPSVAGNISVWSWKPITEVATLTTSIVLPPGWNRALKYNLAVELALEYGRQLDPAIIEIAVESKADLKRMNSELLYLGMDQGALPKKSTWNWFTGE